MSEGETTAHVWTDAQGRAWIDQTNVEVIQLVRDHLAYDWSAEEIHSQYRNLSLAQIHSALAYYFDHQAEFDKQIARLGKLDRNRQPGRPTLWALTPAISG